jgi:glucose/arabinose dehydrogenase
MLRWFYGAPGAAALVLLIVGPAVARADDAPVRKPYGIEKRVPWTTSHIRGTPDPPTPYRTTVAYPNLPRFTEPLELTTAPGIERFFVSERLGKLYSFALDRATDQADLLLDVGRTVYGLAFHPQFRENGYFYVVYVLDPKLTEPTGTRLARFTATLDEQGIPRADLASEQIVLEWPSGGHNGGCIHFGADGYLYIVTGDGSGIADELQTGQDVTDLLGALLRIDVDHPTDGRAYGIPADNPLVGVEGARPEIYAYGLRQFWKFSFDPATRDLWGGEVGQDLWEMVYRVQPGGNYGWSVREGTHPFRPERPLGPTPLENPVIEHSHTLFRSITGGHVYHGRRLADLEGNYIYGDYDTGKVWCFRWDGATARTIASWPTPRCGSSTGAKRPTANCTCSTSSAASFTNCNRIRRKRRSRRSRGC